MSMLNNVVGYWAYIRRLIFGGLIFGWANIWGGGLIFGMRRALVYMVGLYWEGGAYIRGGL